MAGSGNTAAAMPAAVVIFLAVTAALLSSSTPVHAFRTYFPEDAERKGRATVVEVAVPGGPVPAGAPRGFDVDVELIAFAGHGADGAGDVSPGPAPSAGVDELLPDSERVAADVILP